MTVVSERAESVLSSSTPLPCAGAGVRAHHQDVERLAVALVDLLGPVVDLVEPVDGRQVAVEVAVDDDDRNRRPEGQHQRGDQQHAADGVLALDLVAGRGRRVVGCGTRHVSHDSVHNLHPGKLKLSP